MRIKALILSALLICTTASAQDHSAINKKIIFNDFSGGRISNSTLFNLSKNQSEISQNVRLSEQRGALTKRDEILKFGDACGTDTIDGMHRLYLKDGTKKLIVNCSNGRVRVGDDPAGTFTTIFTVATTNKRWQWLTWNNIAIGGDGSNQPLKYDGKSTSATQLGSALATDAGSGAGPDGTYLYKVSCYSTTIEVSLGATSNELTVSDNDIDLTMIPICPDTIIGTTTIGRKIYRTSDSGSDYKLLTNGDMSDNTTVILTDSDTDAARGGALSPDATYTPPTARFPLIHVNRLWFGNNIASSFPSRIYFSVDGTPDYFKAADQAGGAYFNIRPDDGDEITFVKNLLGILTISKNNTIQKLYTTGTDPDADWAISDPFSFLGCQAPYSAMNTTVGIMYLGKDGIYRFNSQNSKLLSDSITPDIRDISFSNFANVWSAFHKNIFYMSYTSSATGSSSNDRVMIYDLLRDAYTLDILNINSFVNLNSGTDVDILFSGSSTNGNVFSHTESVKEVVHRRSSDFGGTFDTVRIIPTRAGGDPEDPVMEIAWTQTIDELSGIINDLTGVVDRPFQFGEYVSQFLTTNASSYDKLFWNEILPSGGGSITFQLRTGSTTEGTVNVAFSSEFTNPSGSDISDVTGDTVLQYKIKFSTDTITQTPTLVQANNFVVRMTYFGVGTSSETTVPLRWRSGFMDLGFPGQTKELKEIIVYHRVDEGTTGTYTITFENFEGDSDTFTIDVSETPTMYKEKFLDSKFIGELIRMDIQESSLNNFILEKIEVRYDVQRFNS